MSKKNYHAYKDYHGPRIPGTKRPHNTEDALRGDDDDDTDENPLGALAWSEGDSLAPPCGSSVPLIHAMLDFASVNQEDVLYDLGCGDARVLLEAAVKKKCRQCVGVEIEEDLVERSNELIESLPLEYREAKESSPQDDMVSTSASSRIHVVHGDLKRVLQEFEWRVRSDDGLEHSTPSERPYKNLPMPTVIALYLLPEGIAEIEDNLVKLLPHTRIVFCSWGLRGIRPIEEKEFHDQKTRASTRLYLYTKDCFERLKGFEYMLSVYHHGH